MKVYVFIKIILNNYVNVANSSGSGSKSSSTSGGGAESHTVVVVTFLDENVPYRFKVPASPLTLKTFKDYLPRKGNYRYVT